MGLMCTPTGIHSRGSETIAKVNIHHIKPTHATVQLRGAWIQSQISVMIGGGPILSPQCARARGPPKQTPAEESTAICKWSAFFFTYFFDSERCASHFGSLSPISYLLCRTRSLQEIVAAPKPFFSFQPFLRVPPSEPPLTPFSKATGLARDLAVIPLCAQLPLISVGPLELLFNIKRR